MTRFIVDGQRRPKEPVEPIDILDSVGLDRRMSPLPIVFELSGLGEFYAAGGSWVDTVPLPLEGEG